MARAFWQHKTSGDVFAVLVNDDGTAEEALGPIYYQDVTQEYLRDIEFGEGREFENDAEWLNDQAVRVVEPDRYYVADDEPTCSACDAECSGHA